MFSTTWNAPEKAFGDKTKFFEGESLESALSHLHRAKVSRYESVKEFCLL